MMDLDASTTIVREIVIDAPAHKIYAALTEPDQLVQWWGDDSSYRTTHMERDLRVGGAWRTSGKGSSGGEFAVKGTYRIIEPPYVLEYTWLYDWSGAKELPVTVVRFDLEERNGSTRVRVTHSGFADAEQKRGHDEGWVAVLGWLRAYVC